jgi:hypothetical protein
MKKSILLVTFLAFATISYGQNVNDRENSIIFSIGGNTSFYTSAVAKWEGEFSYNISIGYEIPLSEKLFLQPELNYYLLNAKASGPISITGNDRLKVSLIGIAPILKYNVYNKFYVEFAPEVNYISNVQRARHGEPLQEKPNIKVKQFSYGVVGGLSYNITKHIGVVGRYHLGLNEVDENIGVYTGSYVNSDVGKISFATFSLFYKF